MSTTEHPTKMQWSDYLLGKVSQTEIEALARHLEQCLICKELVDDIRQSDSLVLDLRHTPRVNGFSGETECIEAVRNCEGIPKEGEQRIEKQMSGESPAQSRSIPSIIGGYRVGEELGTGRFGAVYLAEAPDGEQVALKLYHRSISSADEEEQFRQKGKRLVELRHPHLVRVRRVDIEADQPYAVSDLILGTTLDDLPKSTITHGLKYFRQMALIAMRIAEALHYMHSRDLVHRDVKPANILVDERGTPFLCDFDLIATEEELANHEVIAGTPQYMSPEQIDGNWLDGRSDIFSLGVVLYQTLSGKRPFRSTEARSLFREIHERDPQPLKQINTAIPSQLGRICLKCLQRQPQDRYDTSVDLSKALRRWLKWRSRSLMAIAVVLLIVLGAFVLTAWREPVMPQVVDMDLFIRRNFDDNAIKGYELVQGGTKEPIDHIDPLGPKDDFKLTASFDRATYWYLLWFDTNGVVVLADYSETSTTTMDYPDGNFFMPVNPEDPEGLHLLVLLAGSVQPASAKQLLGSELITSNDLGDRIAAHWTGLRAGGTPRPSGVVLPAELLNDMDRSIPIGLARMHELFFSSTK